MRDTVLIEEMTWPAVRDAIAGGKRRVIVMLGAMEQHGPHLPIGVDTYLGYATGERLARRLGDALVAPVVIYNGKCISFWTIEHRGPVPLEMRPLLGNWIFGCDICQEVCPVNAYPRRAEAGAKTGDAFGAPMVAGRPMLEQLLSLDELQFRDRFRASAIWRARRDGLLRNVCIALGNLADRSAIPALAGALRDREKLIRGHAAWALGQLGGSAARHHLELAPGASCRCCAASCAPPKTRSPRRCRWCAAAIRARALP